MVRSALDQIALEVRDVHKRFGGVHALKGVSFTINKGEVVGLLGDNGAGKSTLVRCISGIHPPDEGAILVNGQPVHIDSPLASREAGIETVFQDLAMVPEFDITENLFLNREIRHKNPILRRLGWLDKKAMEKRAKKALNRLNSRIPSYQEQIHRLSGGQRQAVAIARAVNWGADIVIMDEPTAALGVEQSAQVNELINVISSQGVAVLLISHNMQHVVETCDRAVVLYQGQSVADVSVSDVTKEDLVGLITGAKSAA
ncbi:ribose transport system ATP-binding protein [Pseudoalteromonas rubra]|uniref:ABC transporter ATP-binding protein n=1 Tax=Pseudoalteromonas rubra TaxID=43658 RepID=A0A0L0ELQ9_9GAMM|nr:MULTISPECIES: ATP-binding cassette domain-containing protein [Pseudoalteromonas]ALU44023.1 ABC transporter ATP-binding protein [Pseudoalteromonas rubra]KAF7788663.1 ribose transport system ATP-binding protein [Pseudoalteromonas rubra]KNC65394.1 ABC transporter ATP-binding protein [Pseudoalteromonas rubra]MDK1311901.1 ATP-binding cassette domain-containing protein [Pseudoalteromonas sp. R96]QPB81909.1 ATP-binding cassette domain-containing protein [Pseudoalteromonas rubra]